MSLKVSRQKKSILNIHNEPIYLETDKNVGVAVHKRLKPYLSSLLLIGCTYSNVPKIEVSLENLAQKQSIQKVFVLRNPLLPEHLKYSQLVEHAERTWPERNVKLPQQLEIMSDTHADRIAHLLSIEWYQSLREIPAEWSDESQESYLLIKNPEPTQLARRHLSHKQVLVRNPKNLVKNILNKKASLTQLNTALEKKDSDRIFSLFNKKKKLFAEVARLNTWMFEQLGVDYLVLIDIKGQEDDYNAGKMVLFRVVVAESTTGLIRATLTLPIKQGTIRMNYPSRLALVSTRAFDELRDFEDLVEIPTTPLPAK